MRVFLCEKPSQGKDIARVLGAVQRGNGCYSGAGVVVTWCIGHLVEAVPPEGYGEQYKRWAIEQLPILPERWRVEPKAATAAQFKVVQQLVAKAGELVIATDADREGEMIAREIIDLCGYRGPIQRLWLSALNDASIRKALGALKPSAETLPLYFSALARSRADWLIGMNLSRLFTLLGRQAGYTGVLSVGRVQTPTLKLVVDRDREIARFVSVPYWAVDVLLSHAGQSFTASWIPPEGSTDAAGRCLQQPVAQQAADRIRAARDAQVVSVDTERVREAPPLPFDLGTLQEVCSQSARPRCAGDAGHRPGAVRDAQGDDVSALGLGLSAGKHAGGGAGGARAAGRDRPQPAALDRPARPQPAFAGLERRQGDGARRHHPHARAREPVGHEREGAGRSTG